MFLTLAALLILLVVFKCGLGIETATGFPQYGDTAASSFYTNALNDHFLPVMAEIVTYPNVWLKRLPRTTRRVQGKQCKWLVHYDDANGVAAINENGQLPDPDTEKYARMATDIKSIYVRLKFSGMMKDASASRIDSWLDAVESEATAKSKIMAKARQRMYHNDGSGRLCQIAANVGGVSTGVGIAVADGLVYSLKINQGIESPATCATNPSYWLKVGMVIAIVSSAGVFRGVGKIASKTTTTFTFDVGTSAPVGVVAADDWVVTYSQLGVATAVARDSGYHNEPMGLAGILSDADPDDGTALGHQGVDSDSATFDFHRANILSNSNVLRPVTFELLDLIYTTAIEVGDGVPSLYLTSFGILRGYAKICLADRRFIGQQEFDGGYKGLAYNDTLMLADKDFYKNRIAAVDEEDFEMNVMADPQWMDLDGSVYTRMPNTDAYQATMYCREQMVQIVRKKHVLATDVVES